MSTAELSFAVIVGVVSALGLVLSSILTSRASDRAAKLAQQSIEHQTRLNAKAKVAEFRQAWINNLRDAMAKFVRLSNAGVKADKDELTETMMHIELLMNRRDQRYPELRKYMADFVRTVMGKGTGEDVRFQEFIHICQDILKEEWEVLKKELLELESPPPKIS
jgi:Flp pilus assembly protein TadB